MSDLYEYKAPTWTIDFKARTATRSDGWVFLFDAEQTIHGCGAKCIKTPPTYIPGNSVEFGRAAAGAIEAFGARLH